MDVEGNEGLRTDIEAVVMAIGMRSTMPREQVNGIFYAGDVSNGPTTVVEAVASGKNTALKIDAFLNRKPEPVFERATKSTFASARFQLPAGVRWKQTSSVARSVRPICSPPLP